MSVLLDVYLSLKGDYDEYIKDEDIYRENLTTPRKTLI